MKRPTLLSALASCSIAYVGCDVAPDGDSNVAPRISSALNCVRDSPLDSDARAPSPTTNSVPSIELDAQATAAGPPKEDAIVLSNYAVEENSPTGTVVGTLSHTLTTPNDLLAQYELVNPHSRFRVVGHELQTKCTDEPLVGCLDYEFRPIEDVAVRVTIGAIQAETTLRVVVEDVLDGPTIEVEGGTAVDAYALPFTPVASFSLSEHDPADYPGTRISAVVTRGASNFAFTMNGDTLETFHYGELDASVSDTVELRVTATYQFLGFFAVPFAVRDISLDVLAGTPPPPIDGTSQIRFVVDSDLLDVHSLDEIRELLPAYVDGVNDIYARDTVRQFAFDPEHGVRVLDGDDSDVGVANCVRSPYHVYTVYLITGSPFGQVGGASCGRRGEDELVSVVYDVDRLPVEGAPPDGMIGFESLVFVMAHELGHNHALIDNYFLVNLLDVTGVEPDNSVFGLFYDPDNAYWASRPLTWGDVMGTGGPAPTPFETYSFSPLDAHIVDRYALLEAGDPRLNNGGGEIRLRGEFDVDVTVLDASKGMPLSGCTVTAHFQRITELGASTSNDLRERLEAHTYETGIVDEGLTDASGVATVTLDSRANEHATLFKAQCSDHEPSGAALTVLDFVAAREFPETQGVEGGFNARLVLEATPTTPRKR